VSLIAAVAAIAGLLFGYDTAVINGALVFLRKQFTLSDLGTEFGASSLLIGCLLGAIGTGAVSDRLGRRRSLLLAAVLFAVSSIGAALSQGLPGFSFARIVGGLAIGVASGLTPVYIAEISPSRALGVAESTCGGVRNLDCVLHQLEIVCSGRTKLAMDVCSRRDPSHRALIRITNDPGEPPMVAG
jgi:MFS family permease